MKNLTGAWLYDNGIDYCRFGQIKDGRKICANYFVLSKPLTDVQREKLAAEYPLAAVRSSAPQYAPELVRQTLVHPTKAQQIRDSK